MTETLVATLLSTALAAVVPPGVVVGMPEIRQLSPGEFQQAYCAGAELPVDCKTGHIMGFFHPSLPGVVTLRDGFDEDNHYHVGILLHEIVHHVQFEVGIIPNTRTVDCGRWLDIELQAIDVQEKWLNSHFVPTPHFNLIRKQYARTCK